MTLCWCGNAALVDFGMGYQLCPQCQTLVSGAREGEADYGSNYWFSHQTEDLGHPDLPRRARADLPERCAWWLRTTLRYKPPPARALELGCAHGGYTAMLGWAGYHATGLDLDPAVVEYGRRQFGVTVLDGPLESQAIPPGSLDIIVLNDVLEHFPKPLETVASIAKLLAEDGIAIVQTPGYPPGTTLQQMEGRQDPFLLQMQQKQNEHLYLYSQQSAQRLFAATGLNAVVFEPAIFSQYDMSFVASRQPLVLASDERQAQALESTPGGRLVQALLTAAAERDLYLDEARKRLDVIHTLSSEVDRLRAAKRPWFG